MISRSRSFNVFALPEALPSLMEVGLGLHLISATRPFYVFMLQPY